MTGHPMTTQRAHLWLALLCAACALLTTAVTWGVYEAVPHLEDEHAQLFQAQVFASGHMTAQAVQPVQAFDIPFTIVLGDHIFSKYPPGYAVLLAVGALVGQPWLVNVLLAVLGTLGVYHLGRDLFEAEAGLLAAGLGLVSPMFVMLSGTFLPHIAGLTLLTWFSWAFFRARRSSEELGVRYALAAGAMAGLALAVRPLTAVAVGLPFALLALADTVRQPGRWLNVSLCMLGGLLLGALIWPVYNWAATGNALSNTYQFYWSYDVVGFGPQIGRNGHTLAEGLENIRADLISFEEMGLGWPAWWGLPALWLVCGLGLALPKRSFREAFLVLPAAALVLAYAAYWTRSAGLYGPRYFAEGMPFVWLLAARGLLKLERWAAARLLVRLLLPVWMVWSAAALIFPHFEQARNLYDISRADARIVWAAHLEHALVFVEAGYWTDYARLSWLNPAVLPDAQVIFVRDGGWASNQMARDVFPDRQIYRFDRKAPYPLTACPDPCSLFSPAIIDHNGLEDPPSP